jgi:hypothetical protein
VSKRLSILFINQDFSADNQPKNPQKTFELIKTLHFLNYEVIFLSSIPYFDSQQDQELRTTGVIIIIAGMSETNMRDLLNQVEFVWLLGAPKDRGVLKSIKRKRHIKRIFDTSGLPNPDEHTTTISKKSDVTITAVPEWNQHLTTLGIFHFHKPDVDTLKVMFNNLR